MSSGNSKYHWVDQDTVPISKLKGLKFAEEYEDNQETMTQMLLELQQEKDILSRQ